MSKRREPVGMHSPELEHATDAPDPRSEGGYVPGPGVQVPIKYIREVEPGLHVVSIDGGKPEYLISAAWMKAHPEYGQRALDAINEWRLP